MGLVVPSVALAEDIIDAPEVTIATAAENSGLYLRGDIGYAPWASDGDAAYRTYDAGTGTYGRMPFNGDRFGEPVSATLGLGYQINDMFRADLTGEYFDGRFDGDSRAVLPCAGEGAGTTCAIGTNADVTAYGLMANGYVDLGTLAGFTPYLGAGLGATNLRFSDVTQTSSCIDSLGVCAGGPSATASYNGYDSWRFTYALMAGVSYDVTDRLKLDLGYRYSHIGGGDMFGFGAETLAGATGAKGLDDGLGRHELRAGLRLSIW
ncbi:heat resistant agglutinin 1 protein [Pararhizobium antarcticum]|uniref:Heat resistant agglutinin 1 protein n=2 Tax=Pararhizobium antarcticum TaxID=1798805 RepID=A0A657LMM5_9HYPH|nr:heat resistant agglutinin 1 protein [Pararhizobium antarcticum]OJF94928.1 heat resistant agglutinin 1 protein [Rhizobium sp. 58]